MKKMLLTLLALGVGSLIIATPHNGLVDNSNDDLASLESARPSLAPSQEILATFPGHYNAILKLIGDNPEALKEFKESLEPLQNPQTSVIEYRFALEKLKALPRSKAFSKVPGKGNWLSRTLAPSLLIRHINALHKALTKATAVVEKIRSTSLSEHRLDRAIATTKYKRAKATSKRAVAVWQISPLILLATALLVSATAAGLAATGGGDSVMRFMQRLMGNRGGSGHAQQQQTINVNNWDNGLEP